MKSAVSFSKVFKESSKTSCILNFYHYNAPHISDAGWSSLVARRAHNPKAVGSNPAPATKLQSTEISVLLSFLDESKFNRNKKAQCLETLCLYLLILLDLILCFIANIKMQWHSPFLNCKN